VEASLKLVVVTPEAEKFTKEVSAVTLPGGMGEVGILPGHIPIVSTLEVGILKFEIDGAHHLVVVNKGFFEVNHDQIRVLTQSCEEPSEVDQGRAGDALKRAEERLVKAASTQDIDVKRASAALNRATARLMINKK
jgi:F-type H+-transporting ATPase subunit epsilon